MRPSYLNHGDFYTCKTYSYWYGPLDSIHTCEVTALYNAHCIWTMHNVSRVHVFRGVKWAITYVISLTNRNKSGYGLSKWETTLQCNVVSHWLSPYPKCFLHGPLNWLVVVNWWPMRLAKKSTHASRYYPSVWLVWWLLCTVRAIMWKGSSQGSMTIYAIPSHQKLTSCTCSIYSIRFIMQIRYHNSMNYIVHSDEMYDLRVRLCYWKG